MVCAVAIAQAPAENASVYRPRRPAATLLHRVTRENLETYLAGGDPAAESAANVPFHVEATYRQYLKCGILAHGWSPAKLTTVGFADDGARAYCAGCGHDFLIAWNRFAIPPSAMTVAIAATSVLPVPPAEWWASMA